MISIINFTLVCCCWEASVERKELSDTPDTSSITSTNEAALLSLPAILINSKHLQRVKVNSTPRTTPHHTTVHTTHHCLLICTHTYAHTKHTPHTHTTNTHTNLMTPFCDA